MLMIRRQILKLQGIPMSNELEQFKSDLSEIFFSYAHITAAIELYMITLETTKIQCAISESLFDSGEEWKTIHRFMDLDGKRIEWYPALPAEEIHSRKNFLLGSIYGVYISKMIGCVNSYFEAVLESKTGHTVKSGSCWEKFSDIMKVDLFQCKNGSDIYLWLQERNKIEHTKARIDQTFVDRLLKKGITHSYSSGDSIQKSHLDVLATRTAMIEFASDIDSKISNPTTD